VLALLGAIQKNLTFKDWQFKNPPDPTISCIPFLLLVPPEGITLEV